MKDFDDGGDLFISIMLAVYVIGWFVIMWASQ